MSEAAKMTSVQDENVQVQEEHNEIQTVPKNDEASITELKEVKKGPEPLIDTDILKTNRVKIVDELIIKDALPCLGEHLLATDMDSIRGMKNPREKTRGLIDILHRRTCAKEYRAFNAFLKIVAGNQPDLFSELVGRAPTEEEMDFCVQHFAKALKKVIGEKGHCTDSPLDVKINLDEEHIQLHVVKEQPDSPKSTSDDDTNQLPHAYQAYLEKLEEAGGNIKAKDVFETTGIESKAQKVLIRGRAGVGKTTTMQWFARRWASGDWATGFTLLFLLQLRYLTDTASMISAYDLLTLYGLFKLDDKMITSTCAPWLKNSGNRLLILVDGLDEISNFAAKLRNSPVITDIHQKANPIDLCVNIIRGNIFPGCTIICASRPFTGLSELSQFSKLEILGLTKVGVGNYVQSRYRDNSKRIMSVLASIPILMSLSSITFYCMLICSLLNDNVTLEEDDIQTYTRLISCLIVKHVSRKLPDWPFVVEVNAYFSKLAKLAYNGIFKSKQGLSKLVFNEFDLAEVKLTPSDLESIKKVGLLQVKETETKSCKSIRAEFLHLSVQEMLAVAYCLSDESITYDMLARVFSGGHFDMALLCLFGLCFDREFLWIKNVLVASGNLNRNAESLIEELFNDMRTKDTIDTHMKLKICQLVNEGQVERHARAVLGEVVVNRELTIEHIPMTILDLSALNFVCQHATNLSVLVLVNVNTDNTFAGVLSSSFLKRHCSTLQVLDVSTNRIQPEGAKLIAAALQPNRSLTVLNIAMNKIGSEGAIAIAEMLQTKANLDQLDISANNIGADGAEAIAGALSQKTMLTTLLISANNIQLGGLKAIAAVIHGSSSMRNLDISANNIGDQGMRAFAEVKSSVRNLIVSQNLIGYNGAKAIGKLLCQNKTISCLDISQNKLGANVPKSLIEGLQNLQILMISQNKLEVHGANALFHALRKNTALRRLDVSFNNISGKGTSGLSVMLKENHVLETLQMNGNNTGASGAKELAAAILQNNSLRELHISGNDIGIDGQMAITGMMGARSSPIKVVFGTMNVEPGNTNASLNLVERVHVVRSNTPELKN